MATGTPQGRPTSVTPVLCRHQQPPPSQTTTHPCDYVFSSPYIRAMDSALALLTTTAVPQNPLVPAAALYLQSTCNARVLLVMPDPQILGPKTRKERDSQGHQMPNPPNFRRQLPYASTRRLPSVLPFSHGRRFNPGRQLSIPVSDIPLSVSATAVPSIAVGDMKLGRCQGMLLGRGAVTHISP
jgi:hypothetical protein